MSEAHYYYYYIYIYDLTFVADASVFVCSFIFVKTLSHVICIKRLRVTPILIALIDVEADSVC